MKRIDLYKQKLKAAKAELPMRQRQFNAASRHLHKTYQTIKLLEQKINVYLAKH
jgi:hypothetical protein